jgi:hypothetical protein
LAELLPHEGAPQNPSFYQLGIKVPGDDWKSVIDGPCFNITITTNLNDTRYKSDACCGQPGCHAS